MSLQEKLDQEKGCKTIMSDIKEILKNENVDFTASQSEIIVKDRRKKEVCGFLKSLPLSKDTISLLIDIVETKKCVYIRKKISV